MEFKVNSDTVSEIIAAFVKAQAKFKTATKDSKNEHFKQRYASLESVVEACLPALNAEGIALNHSIICLPGPTWIYGLFTTLRLKEEWLGSLFPLNPDKPGPQSFKAAVTYAKRTNLLALTGIAEDDDDGERAEGRHPAKYPPVAKAITLPPNQFNPESGKFPFEGAEVVSREHDAIIPHGRHQGKMLRNMALSVIETMMKEWNGTLQDGTLTQPQKVELIENIDTVNMYLKSIRGK